MTPSKVNARGVIMLGHPPEGGIPEHLRKKIFHLLVAAQDMEMSVAESRLMIAEKFGLNEDRVRRIEREGIERGWLDE
jgi:hypothetical protein